MKVYVLTCGASPRVFTTHEAAMENGRVGIREYLNHSACADQVNDFLVEFNREHVVRVDPMGFFDESEVFEVTETEVES